MAAPGLTWRRRFNVPEHMTLGSQNAPVLPATAQWYSIAPGKTWRRRFGQSAIVMHYPNPAVQQSSEAQAGLLLRYGRRVFYTGPGLLQDVPDV